MLSRKGFDNSSVEPVEPTPGELHGCISAYVWGWESHSKLICKVVCRWVNFISREEILKTKCIWQKLLLCVIVTTVIGKILLLIHTLLVEIKF